MPKSLPDAARRLLADRAYGHIITRNADGSPQVTMVWMDVDGDDVIFNTAEGRRKVENLRRDPRVVVSVQDRAHPQQYLLVHGHATLTSDGAEAHIDRLSERFVGQAHYQGPRNGRLIVRVAADRIAGMGPWVGSD